jgi:hypothetical protein
VHVADIVEDDGVAVEKDLKTATMRRRRMMEGAVTCVLRCVPRACVEKGMVFWTTRTQDEMRGART